MNFSAGHVDTAEIRKVGEEDRILSATELRCIKNLRLCGRNRVSVPWLSRLVLAQGRGRALVWEAQEESCW